VLDRVASQSKTARSKGFYFVRYHRSRGRRARQKNDSFLASSCSGAPRPIRRPSSIAYFVKDRNDSSEVQVLNRKAIRIPRYGAQEFSPCCSTATEIGPDFRNERALRFAW